MRLSTTIIVLFILAVGGCSSSTLRTPTQSHDAGPPDAPVPPDVPLPPNRPDPEKRRRELPEADDVAPPTFAPADAGPAIADADLDWGDTGMADAGPADAWVADAALSDAGVVVVTDAAVRTDSGHYQPVFAVGPLPAVPPLHVVGYPGACQDTVTCCSVGCTAAGLNPVPTSGDLQECAQRSADLGCVNACYTLHSCCYEVTGGNPNGECDELGAVDGHVYAAWCSQQAALHCPAGFGAP